MAKSSNWFVYILRCADNSLYTGITTDLDRRLLEHNAEKSISKYTRARQPVTMVYSEAGDSRSSVGKREVFIKSLTRVQKEKLLDNYAVSNSNSKSKTKP